MSNLVHRSFFCLLALLRHLGSTGGSDFRFNPFLGLFKTAEDPVSASYLNNRLKELPNAVHWSVTRAKIAEINECLAAHSIVILSQLREPVRAAFVSRDCCLMLEDLELFVRVGAGVSFSDAMRMISVSDRIKSFVEYEGIPADKSSLLGINLGFDIKSWLEGSGKISLFELWLLSSEFEIDWNSVAEIDDDHANRLRQLSERLRENLLPDRIAGIRQEVIGQLGRIKTEVAPIAAKPEELDLSGDWIVMAAEFDVDQTCFMELFESGVVGSFNRTKTNLPKVSRLFKGTVHFVNTKDAGGAGKSQKLGSKDSVQSSMSYLIKNVEIDGHRVDARYDFAFYADRGNGIKEQIKSYGDFKLKAVGPDELRGFYCGYEPYDMTDPECPSRDFPLVSGFLRVVRVKENPNH